MDKAPVVQIVLSMSDSGETKFFRYMKPMGTVVIQGEAGPEEIQVLSLLLLCESHGNRGVIRFAMALDRPWVV